MEKRILGVSLIPLVVTGLGMVLLYGIDSLTPAAFAVLLMLATVLAWGLSRARFIGRFTRTGTFDQRDALGEEPYRELFENATDIVFTTDLSRHFLTGNKAVQRLLGYTVEEAQELTWERLVAPCDMEKGREMYKRHAAGEQHINYELDAVTKSGEIHTFEIGSRPLYDDRGRVAGFHGIARDISERKRMEAELIEARRAAEEANKAKSNFLANISHEIRTPLNGILGFVSLLAKTPLSRKQREYLSPIEESSSHLLKAH